MEKKFNLKTILAVTTYCDFMFNLNDISRIEILKRYQLCGNIWIFAKYVFQTNYPDITYGETINPHSNLRRLLRNYIYDTYPELIDREYNLDSCMSFDSWVEIQESEFGDELMINPSFEKKSKKRNKLNKKSKL